MIRTALASLLLAQPLYAEAPRVVTDILPVQAIVSAVMGDIASPVNMVAPGSSPHRAALRPSQARALEGASLVVRMGPRLTPWLEESIEALAPDTAGLTLLELDGTKTLEAREEAVFDLGEDDDHAHDEHGHDEHEHDEHAHDDHGHDDHGHDDHGHDDHGHDEHEEHAKHDDHDDHAHDDHDDHDEHGHDEHAHDADKHEDEDHAAHDHDHDHAHAGGVDPHAWLSPDNAILWTGLIADALAAQDPDNAATYQANAAASIARIEAAIADTRAALASVTSVPFVVYHDAFQYFETYFELNAVGAVLSGDAEAASAKRVSDLTEAVDAVKLTCIFTEPQMPARLARMLQDRHATRVAELDPMGTEALSDTMDYAAYLRYVGTAIGDCLTGNT